MRNLSLPVVWEDADTPEEWERDASAIPSQYSQGRYVFWGWARPDEHVLQFNGSTRDWPGIYNLSRLKRQPAIDKVKNGKLRGIREDAN